MVKTDSTQNNGTSAINKAYLPFSCGVDDSQEIKNAATSVKSPKDETRTFGYSPDGDEFRH